MSGLYTVQPSGSSGAASGGTTGNMGGFSELAGPAVSLLGSLGNAYSLYKSIGDADDYIGRLGAYKLNPGTGYGLSEAKNALLNYSPVPYATTSDFGWNPRQAELSLLGSTASGALSSSNAGLAGLTTAFNFTTGLIGNTLSHRKAINEVNKYNKEVGRLNTYNKSVLDSNLKNTKADMLYNSIYNSMANGGPLSIGQKLMTPFGKRFSKGGSLSSPLHSYGADWTNGLTFINNGNSHESNPYDGVQLGVDNKGVPNLVEEGEVIWNDYVFSNRLRVPKAIRRKYKLGGIKELTFADAVKRVQKESEERPNDPISQRGLDDMLIKLAVAQETIRAIMNNEGKENKYAQGGITIKPSKKGTFTAAATKHGMGVQEFASKVLANKEDYSPAMVKKANFARNAAKWHALGGNLYPLGGDIEAWVNGLSDDDYVSIFSTLPNFHKYRNDRAGLIAYANTGKPDKYFNTITNAYNKAQEATKATPATTTGESVPDIKDDDNFDLPGTTVTAQANTWKNPYFKDNIWDPGYYSYVSKLVAENPEEGQILYNPEGKFGVVNQNMAMPKDLVDNLHSTAGANNAWSHIAVNQYQDYLKSLENEEEDGEIIERGSSPLEYFRYAPIVGSAVGLFANRNPDYSHPNAILSAIQGIRDIHPRILGDYRKYTPFDTLFYANPLGAEARDTKRSLAASAAGNRGQAMSGILAADYNYINSLGQLARQAQEYNMNQSKEVSEFNRDTHKFNIEQDLRAQLANAENFKLKMNALSQAYALKDAQDARLSAGLSANFSNLFNNLGNLGIDASNRLDRDWLVRTGALMGDMTFAEQQKRDKRARGNSTAYGGRIKRRRGLTI